MPYFPFNSPHVFPNINVFQITNLFKCSLFFPYVHICRVRHWYIGNLQMTTLSKKKYALFPETIYAQQPFSNRKCLDIINTKFGMLGLRYGLYKKQQPLSVHEYKSHVKLRIQQFTALFHMVNVLNSFHLLILSVLWYLEECNWN